MTRSAPREPWWRAGVCYQVYVRSFADSDGDGTGDLPGVTARLSHLASLGVDAVWLTPFYPSPMVDGGYDVVDHRDVDPLFGALADVDALVAEAHRLGLRVVCDLVPNHTSDRHPWFRAALAAPPGSAARRRYVFRPVDDDQPDQPPNDWQSAFGGSAWRRVPSPDGGPDEWYLHLFSPEQPDLNWDNPEVPAEFRDIVRWWLDRGVDGLRIDMAHALFKHPDLVDAGPGQHTEFRRNHLMPFFDQAPVHCLYRQWRTMVDAVPGERALIGEVCLFDADRQARYVRPDELHQAFTFELLECDWSAPALRDTIGRTLEAYRRVGALPAWVLNSHDATRTVTRYGGGERGLRRARAAALLMLALPGAAYVYQGEELGLPQVDLPDEALRDPVWERSGRTVRGRDGSRVPIPWTADGGTYGFAPEGAEPPWLPQPDGWGTWSVQRQTADPASTLAFYQAAIRSRRELSKGVADKLTWWDIGLDVVGFRRGEGFGCAVNLGDRAVPLTDVGRLLLTSAPVPPADESTLLPPDTAVWFVPACHDAGGHARRG
ncbi:alpha-amylase family glycosyl hydrolase [Micromonospora sp. SL4-19]|uniref:glycoside hydrolase family 13 protein n=1 Tax=Micromonospora sp. SL4-19 TaxID=3399129 RepID=UPI003A4DFA9C